MQKHSVPLKVLKDGETDKVLDGVSGFISINYNYVLFKIFFFFLPKHR